MQQVTYCEVCGTEILAIEALLRDGLEDRAP